MRESLIAVLIAVLATTSAQAKPIAQYTEGAWELELGGYHEAYGAALLLPSGLVDGLPVGLQVLAGHHREELLLDLALAAEREFSWPLVAPGSPHNAPS